MLLLLVTMKHLTSEGFSSLLVTSPRVLLLLHTRGDDLCAEAITSLASLAPGLEVEGFDVVAVDVTDTSVSYSDDLSCVRVPQVRVFISGKLRHKTVGVPSSSSLLSLLRTCL